MLATISMAIFLAQASLGGGHGPHASRGGGCCACGASPARVSDQIFRLQGSPRGHEREDAAGDLDDFDWRCHPEVAEALATAMLRDPEEEVREEAAESLAEMRPCLPTVHRALQHAATYDPDEDTREQARKALASVGGRCTAACALCGPVPGPRGVAVPAPIRLEPSAGAYLDSHPLAPPSELPPAIPGVSPFAPGASGLAPPPPARLAPPPPPVPIGPYGPAY